ncbi:MAG: hypothetical protein ACJLS3_07085 [Erythrobacter sp.]
MGSPFEELEWIRSDNHAAGRLAAQHLLNAGYQRPCFMGALDGMQKQFAERYEGYAAAMREAGREPILIVPPKSPTREEEGRGPRAIWWPGLTGSTRCLPPATRWRWARSMPLRRPI